MFCRRATYKILPRLFSQTFKRLGLRDRSDKADKLSGQREQKRSSLSADITIASNVRIRNINFVRQYLLKAEIIVKHGFPPHGGEQQNNFKEDPPRQACGNGLELVYWLTDRPFISRPVACQKSVEHSIKAWMRGRPKWHALRIKFSFSIPWIDSALVWAARIRKRTISNYRDGDHTGYERVYLFWQKTNARNTIKSMATINGKTIGG